MEGSDSSTFPICSSSPRWTARCCYRQVNERTPRDLLSSSNRIMESPLLSAAVSFRVIIIQVWRSFVSHCCCCLSLTLEMFQSVCRRFAPPCGESGRSRVISVLLPCLAGLSCCPVLNPCFAVSLLFLALLPLVCGSIWAALWLFWSCMLSNLGGFALRLPLVVEYFHDSDQLLKPAGQWNSALIIWCLF